MAQVGWVINFCEKSLRTFQWSMVKLINTLGER